MQKEQTFNYCFMVVSNLYMLGEIIKPSNSLITYFTMSISFKICIFVRNVKFMLQNKGKIEHSGIITKIENDCIYVSITQLAACAECHAKTMCSISESKNKIIEIPYTESGFKPGDSVMVTGTPTMGLMAVLYAFVIPLTVILLMLFIFDHFFGSETLAALLCIVSLALYFVVLYLFRKKLKKKFVFTLTKN